VQKKPAILHFFAILLILVFSQKSGTGLFLHNLLHNQNIIVEHPGKEDQKSKDMGYACSCIDDFFMPIEGSGIIICPQPVLHPDIPPAFFKEQISFYTSDIISLRGPPAYWL